MFNTREPLPTATLSLPVVKADRALKPKATLSSTSLQAASIVFAPTAVF